MVMKVDECQLVLPNFFELFESGMLEARMQYADFGDDECRRLFMLEVVGEISQRDGLSPEQQRDDYRALASLLLEAADDH